MTDIGSQGNANQPLKLLDLPYPQRQRIAILDKPQLDPPNFAKKIKDWMQDGGSISHVAKWGALAVGSLIYPPLILPIAAVGAYALVGAKGNAPTSILAVTAEEVKDVKFPAGHPLPDILYIGHPIIPAIYYPAASFHSRNFEHKFSEIIHILMSLGATQIRVEFIEGWAREMASKVNVGVLSANTGVALGGSKQSQASLLFEATLPGVEQPSLPQDLAWYPTENTWQQIAEGRLKFGLQQFSLNLDYKDDFGVNAGLAKTAEAAGIGLGGTWQEYKSTEWNINGTFS